MQRREKILAGVVGLLVALFVVQWLFESVMGAFDARNQRITALQTEIQRKQMIVSRGLRAGKQIEAWEQRSLPFDGTDAGMANSLYAQWLTELAGKERIASVVVSPGTPRKQTTAGGDTIVTFPASINGTATLSQLVQLLHSFYRTDFLHQVTNLSLSPLQNNQLSLVMSVEAMALPTPDRHNALPELPPSDTVAADVEEYRNPIINRDLFAVYKEPKKPEPPKPVTVTLPPVIFDDAKMTKLTAIAGPESDLEAWFNVQTTGKTLRLRQGDQFSVGQLQGEVRKIDSRSVVISADGRERTITLGNMLREADSTGSRGRGR